MLLISWNSVWLYSSQSVTEPGLRMYTGVFLSTRTHTHAHTHTPHLLVRYYVASVVEGQGGISFGEQCPSVGLAERFYALRARMCHVLRSCKHRQGSVPPIRFLIHMCSTVNLMAGHNRPESPSSDWAGDSHFLQGTLDVTSLCEQLHATNSKQANVNHLTLVS